MASDKTAYISTYTPSLLESIPRKDQRETLGIGEELPFNGLDIWNAYEFTWLHPSGKPEVAVAQFEVPVSGEFVTRLVQRCTSRQW